MNDLSSPYQHMYKIFTKFVESVRIPVFPLEVFDVDVNYIYCVATAQAVLFNYSRLRDAGGFSSLRKNKNKGRKKGQVKDSIFERSPDSRRYSRYPPSPSSSVVSNTCFEYWSSLGT